MDELVPMDEAAKAARYIAEERAKIGDWTNPRGSGEPGRTPFPEPGNLMLEYLVNQFFRRVNEGRDASEAFLDAIVHSWYEGHIEGYNRAMSEV